MISLYITVTLCQECAVPTIFHIALWEVMLMVDLGISLSQGINDTLKIIFSDSGFFFPHQDICSLILSLNIIHSLLNEIRQHSDSDPPQHRVLANSSVISQSNETVVSAPQFTQIALTSSSLPALQYVLSETETTCPHTDGWTIAAICLFCSGMLSNNGVFFFNPTSQDKTSIVHIFFYILLWNMHASVCAKF